MENHINYFIQQFKEEISDDDWTVSRWLLWLQANNYKIIHDRDIDDSWVGQETLINFRGDLRMSQPWRSYSDDEVFTIIRRTKAGLYILRDSKGQEHPLQKSVIKYFKNV